MTDRVCQLLTNKIREYDYLLDSDRLSDAEKTDLKKLVGGVTTDQAGSVLNLLCHFLEKHHGKKVILLLDEYDTPMQEAYLSDFWDEAVEFFRDLFNNTFKTNPSLARAVITGITRISKESLFSDINNLQVVSTTTPLYQTAFGFTEEEVFAAMDEQELSDKETVKLWYDGFVFGGVPNIYNPWSIIGYFKEHRFQPFWINTSSNSLIGNLIRSGNIAIKTDFSDLLEGKEIRSTIEEEVVFNQLDGNKDAIWGLMVASGYLKVLDVEYDITDGANTLYTLAITNTETKTGLRRVVRAWFGEQDRYGYHSFTKALVNGDLDAMNGYMQRVTEHTMSYFDPYGKGGDPELYYHGFVLGLIIELDKTYQVRSNRESGFGRYDIMLIPREPAKDDGIIIEFKLMRRDRGEKSLSDTVKAALLQIEEKHYEAELLDAGVPKERIRKYGFAFEGKEVLIGKMNGQTVEVF